MKVALAMTCSSLYSIFWRGFYKSFRDNFLSSSDVHYFVFSESMNLCYADEPDVTIIPWQHRGWPYIVTDRVLLCAQLMEQYAEYDYVFCVNVNLRCIKPVSEEEFLPANEENLIGIRHPGMEGKKLSELAYDRNINSSAYFSEDEGQVYIQTALYGGRREAFYKACLCINEWTQKDEKTNNLAEVFDESYYNRYICNQGYANVKILPPSYLYPEQAHYYPAIKKYASQKKIVQLEKDLYIEAEKSKGVISNNGGNRLKRLLKWVYWKTMRAIRSRIYL